ncbi:thioesterase-like superfamily-domain-containing protein [Xylariales sp. PMI_506]|nr:thioesterase-like superfamily-domain-containing protein [Xylariales sp. PMI_506]
MSPRRVPLPVPQDRLSWTEQMNLKQVQETVFRSTAGAPYGNFTKRNGEQRPRAFGGHVYAQAVYAASKTVGKGLVVHSVTGYFTVLGLADEPFTYQVKVIRSGGNYSVRHVIATQEDDATICFTCLCSFKRPEPGFIKVQEQHNVKKKFEAILQGKEPEELDIKTNIKNLAIDTTNVQTHISPNFSGLLTSVVPLESINNGRRPLDREGLYFFSANLEPSLDPDYNLEACAHLFHSDRESIWSIIRSYELLDILDVGSSLSHTVIFHVGGEELSFNDKQGRKRWFYQETESKRIGDGRVLHQGKIYNREGVLVASSMQDGALKLKKMTEAEVKERERRLNTPPKL